MAPFSYETKCFNCFKKLEVTLDYLIFDGPSTSASVNIKHQETTIDLIEEIDNLRIKVSFCNEECKNVGESELKKCTAHLMILKEDILKMESELPEVERKRREAVWEFFRCECIFLIDYLMVLKHVSLRVFSFQSEDCSNL